MLGNIAVQAELEKLLKLLAEMERAKLSADEQLRKLRRHIQKTIKAAESGWL